MKTVQFPLELKGDWNNAIFLTYSINFAFFEKSIWGLLGPKCKNIVILADELNYLKECQYCADKKVVHWVNRKYIIDGVSTRTFHPKLVLLTNQESGILLVGSGNLNLQGYGNSGEMFAKYEYNSKSSINLNSFIQFRKFLELLISRDFVQPRVRMQIERLFEKSPWLYSETGSDQVHINSNFETSFLNQISALLESVHVEELWIHSPFYDEKANALQKLIEQIKPDNTHILIQPGNTSIDPKRLEDLSNVHPGKIFIQPIALPNFDDYIHNKFYLFRTGKEDFLIQGSPNLSRAAFLNTPSNYGNFEIANILNGKKGSFQYIIDHLIVKDPVTNLNELDLSYKGSKEDNENIISDSFRLTGAELNRNQLVVYINGKISDPKSIQLNLSGNEIQISPKEINTERIVFEVTPQVIELIKMHSFLSIHYDKNNNSNSVPILIIEELDRVLNIEESQSHLESVGDLDIVGQDLVDLIYEIQKALLFDKQDIMDLWYEVSAKKQKNFTYEEIENFKYEDIDFGMLKAHPKYKQYRNWRPGGSQYKQSSLQIILNSIIKSFQAIDQIEKENTKSTEKAIEDTDFEDIDPDNEEEIEEFAARNEENQRKLFSKYRNIFKRFIRRYISGISRKDFVDFIDPDVIANNYVIFSHLLLKLLTKEWIDERFIVESFIKIWDFMWGNNEVKGYVENLQENDLDYLKKIIESNHGIGNFICAVFYCDHLSKANRWVNERMKLKNNWESFLTTNLSMISKEGMLDAWRLISGFLAYSPPNPCQISSVLIDLLTLETETSFLRSLEKSLGLEAESCKIEFQKIHRESTNKLENIKCLLLPTKGILQDQETSIEIWNRWMNFEMLDFCRIIDDNNKTGFLYDTPNGKGIYYNKNKDIDVKDLSSVIINEYFESVEKLYRVADSCEKEIELKRIVDDSVIEKATN